MPSTHGKYFNGLTGWLFLACGMTTLACVVLIPASDDLSRARWRMAQAQAVLEHKRERLDNYSTYLEALHDGDETVMVDLAASQLNLAPADRIPVWMDGDVDHFSASVFDRLEPEPLQLPQLALGDSTLRRLIESDRVRPMLIVGGAVCVLIGLLPPATRRDRPRRLPRPNKRDSRPRERIA